MGLRFGVSGFVDQYTIDACEKAIKKLDERPIYMKSFWSSPNKYRARVIAMLREIAITLMPKSSLSDRVYPEIDKYFADYLEKKRPSVRPKPT